MKKHELNRSFSWEERQGPFRLISEEQAQGYNERGFFVLEDAFDPETVAALLAEIEPIEAKWEAVLREKFGGKAFIARADEITFTTHLVGRSSRAQAFTLEPILRDLCYDLLGPDVRLYWDQLVSKKPGTVAPFPWHQDNGYTFIEPQQYLTCWVALTDATESNGCPRVIPGRHREGTFAHRPSDLGFVCVEGDPPEAISAPVRAGGIVVFSSLTPHATGPNLTSDVRKAYIVQYAPDGAQMVPREGDQSTRVACDAPERQYPVLIDGSPAPAPPPPQPAI